MNVKRTGMPWVELELPNFHNVVFKQEICTNRSTVIGEIVSTHKIVGGSIRQLFHEKDELCAACINFDTSSFTCIIGEWRSR